MDDSLIHDLFASEGPVEIRRMFGGHGIYLDGMIVAIEIRGEVLLKGDDRSAPFFEAAGSRQWRYERTGKSPVAMPYFFLPSEAYDDPDAMALWARRAREAALRAMASGNRRKKNPKAPSRSA